MCSVVVDSSRKITLSSNSSLLAAWAREIERCYGAAAGEVFGIEAKAKKNDVQKRLERIDSMEKNWDAICAQLKTLPEPAYLKALLDDIGCPSTPEQIGINAAEFLLNASPIELAKYAQIAEPSQQFLININTADLHQLCQLPQIGEKTAQRIIAHREQYGRFITVEQIKEVNGIGEAIFKNIEDLITVD